MILSDRDLRGEMAAGRLSVEPLGERAIQPASVDVRLATHLLLSTPKGWAGVDMGPLGGFDLDPGDFVLASTLESVHVPDDLLCMVHGRSTTGRMGLIVETAGLVDPGWRGTITLELTNISAAPVRLIPGAGIAQLTFQRLASTCAHPYGSPGLGSRYQGQVGPTPPR